jgi:hypothetical protein
MRTQIRLALLVLSLLLSPVLLTAATQGGAEAALPAASGALSEYKVLSGFKQPFNDGLRYHLSKGWQPVGGVSVTTWNNDLYFAQLIGRPAAASR